MILSYLSINDMEKELLKPDCTFISLSRGASLDKGLLKSFQSNA
jgi:hypothetical protein